MEGNLQNSFSVVGLLQESDSFYEMIHERINYLNMKKTIDVNGQRHSSSNKGKKPMCEELYSKNESFQEHIHSSLPAFGIYYVGVEVNRFQKEELAQYGWLLGGWTIFNYKVPFPITLGPRHKNTLNRCKSVQE